MNEETRDLVVRAETAFEEYLDSEERRLNKEADFLRGIFDRLANGVGESSAQAIDAQLLEDLGLFLG